MRWKIIILLQFTIIMLKGHMFLITVQPHTKTHKEYVLVDY